MIDIRFETITYCLLMMIKINLKLVSSTVSKLLGKDQVAVIEPSNKHYVRLHDIIPNVYTVINILF